MTYLVIASEAKQSPASNLASSMAGDRRVATLLAMTEKV
jgi:hypothetical protein